MQMKNGFLFYSIFFWSLLNSILLLGQSIKDEELLVYKTWPRYKGILQVYNTNKNMLLWMGKEAVQKELIEILHQAPSLGLEEKDYQFSFLKNWQANQAAKIHLNPIETDIRFTDAALHFFTDVKTGSKMPSFDYQGLMYVPDENEIASQLKVHLIAGGLKNFLIELQPRSKEYALALHTLNFFQHIVSGNSFIEKKIISTKVDSTNKPLLLRLYQLGFADSLKLFITKKELLQNLKLAQSQFDLLNDGVRSTTLEALNIPLRQRIKELKNALNTFRWLEGLKQRGIVLFLNIPSANFFVYESGKLVLYSRVIVGKPSTPTPTLTSTITEVVLYPYWMVPHKIAVNELLPSIKKNIGFLELGNFQVLNKNGKVVNPYAINWQSLNKGYFPYIIRQSTGCDNSLGLVKFNFDNPFTVYIHDTPGKILFSSARRFYSHGCMRIEKPQELALLVLGRDRIKIDTLTAKGCLNHQSPTVVKAEKPLPIVVLYSPVWYTEKGELRFYNDVYKRVMPLNE